MIQIKEPSAKQIEGASKESFYKKDVLSVSLIDIAIEYAARAHQSQKRKGSDIPYISHPYGVGMILLKARCKEEEVIAGILHDTLEDTDTTEDELKELFGQKILDIVKGCSEPDKSASWEVRKQHTLVFLKQAPLSIRKVACADKLHNLRSLQRDLSTMGEEVWKIFKRGRDKQKWYYTQIVESLGYASRFPLLDTLQVEVEKVFGAPLRDEKWGKLRENKLFFDQAFETVFAPPEKRKQLEHDLAEMGGLELIQQVYSLSYPIHPDFEKEFKETAKYLKERGIRFRTNSEGPMILLGFCVVLKHVLNLYPHELYHHFQRNRRRGIL